MFVEIRFTLSDRVVFVPPGTTLLQAAAAAGTDITTGCTRGMCGTDPVEIVAGAEGLEPPGDDERGTLERMGLSDAFRLSCSARVRSGPITVRV